jgi:hypothetical protein
MPRSDQMLAERDKLNADIQDVLDQMLANAAYVFAATSTVGYQTDGHARSVDRFAKT